MTIKVAVHSNGDDALIAWRPLDWDETWVGFRVERRSGHGDPVVLNNRIPPTEGEEPVDREGIASDASPFRRCIWVDHAVEDISDACYRVTPMAKSGAGYIPVDSSASEWTDPLDSSLQEQDGVRAVFNRGTIMSQVVTRMLDQDVSVASIKKFKVKLARSGFPGRRYLSGEVRTNILNFLAEADSRGNHVYLAIYEFNDQELAEGVKAFGSRAHLLLGNGGTTEQSIIDSIEAGKVRVFHRDLSHSGASSPSVHNKFVVEVDRTTKKATRVLTGSTNWTVTGLCTQLNNVLIIERPATAAIFLKQWKSLKAAGDDMTDELKELNSTEKDTDGPVTTWFTATKAQVEFTPVLDAIANAKQGILFLMFQPGESPLLTALLDKARDERDLYVRGVVSTVKETLNGTVKEHKAQVYRTGKTEAPPELNEKVFTPTGVPESNTPSWALQEFDRQKFFSAGLNAIVHSKALVIDPFSDECVVVTGSHNFSPSASKSNDENMVIIRGNRPLARAYAVHMQGVYDHYSWRAFLNEGGNPDAIYESLAGWHRRGSNRERELAFWMGRQQ